MKQTKVLHIITRLILGGAQENTVYSAAFMDRMPEYDVELITGPAIGPEGDLTYLAEKYGVKLIKVSEMRRAINPALDFISFLKILKIIKKGKYGIVHTHSSKAGVIGRLAAKVAGVPIIIHTIHGLPFCEYQNCFANFVYVWLEKLCALISDKIITVADIMAEKSIKAGVAKKDKFRTVRSGMEMDSFLNVKTDRNVIRKRFGIKDDEIVVGKIARLFALKGHCYVVDAAKIVAQKYANVKFFFAGDGILMDELKNQAKRLGIEDRIIFGGLIKREEIPDIISIMDIVVHASLREGLARALVQALAEEKPVISFDIDGAREVVINDRTGYLVKPEDVEALAGAIINAIDKKDKAKQMAKEGRELVTREYTIDAMVNGIDAVYKEIISVKNTSPIVGEVVSFGDATLY